MIANPRQENSNRQTEEILARNGLTSEDAHGVVVVAVVVEDKSKYERSYRALSPGPQLQLQCEA